MLHQATVFVGLYLHGVLIFVVVPILYTQKCYPILFTCLPYLTHLSMISSSIHAIKEGRQYAKSPLVALCRMLINYGNKLIRARCQR